MICLLYLDIAKMDRKVMERKGLWVKVIRVLKKRMQIKKYIRENDSKRI